jgi:hypothetical protein
MVRMGVGADNRRDPPAGGLPDPAQVLFVGIVLVSEDDQTSPEAGVRGPGSMAM